MVASKKALITDRDNCRHHTRVVRRPERLRVDGFDAVVNDIDFLWLHTCVPYHDKVNTNIQIKVLVAQIRRKVM